MSTEEYRGFTFRYVRDPDVCDAIRIYVEDMPDTYKNISLREIHLWQPGAVAPPRINVSPGLSPKSIGDARRIAYKWADTVLKSVPAAK